MASLAPVQKRTTFHLYALRRIWEGIIAMSAIVCRYLFKSLFASADMVFLFQGLWKSPLAIWATYQQLCFRMARCTCGATAEDRASTLLWRRRMRPSTKFSHATRTRASLGGHWHFQPTNRSHWPTHYGWLSTIKSVTISAIPETIDHIQVNLFLSAFATGHGWYLLSGEWPADLGP